MREVILNRLAGAARSRLARTLAARPLSVLRSEAEALAREECARDGTFQFAFEQAVHAPGLSVIAELKRASPSKGLIAAEFPILEIAAEYEAGGANALSVLTEPTEFLGSDAYLSAVSAATHLPTLRKDFTVHEAMIYEAKLLGAKAVLLIMGLLSNAAAAEYLALAHSLGLSALVEAHGQDELERALSIPGIRLVGVNNRNLNTFEVDFSMAARLRALVPAEVAFVAESGIRSAQDAALARSFGADAVLVGEALMRATDRAALIAALKGAER